MTGLKFHINFLFLFTDFGNRCSKITSLSIDVNCFGHYAYAAKFSRSLYLTRCAEFSKQLYIVGVKKC